MFLFPPFKMHNEKMKFEDDTILFSIVRSC